MSLQLKFINDFKQIQKLYEFIKSYPLDYPNYPLWLEKCKRQLEINEKLAFYVTSNDRIAGSLVFQRHNKEYSVLELKNLRVLEEFSHQGIASQLEQMVVLYGQRNGFKRIRCDAHFD